MSASPDFNTSLEIEPTKPAYAQVAAHIRNAIIEGRLQPGERLPVELELTRMFGVSRSTVREALRTLTSQNLINTTRGITGGSYVAHPEPENITGYLETTIGLLSDFDELTLRELMEARQMLEVPACRIAAERSTPNTVAELGRALDGSDQDAAVEFARSRVFHEVLLSAAGNRLVALLAEPIFNVLRTKFAQREADEAFWRAARTDHREILDAVAAKDGNRASALMDAHLKRLAKTYTKMGGLAV